MSGSTRGSDKNRPLRNMGKDWKKLSLVTTPDTAQWVEDEAKRRSTSKTAVLDEIVTKAKWRSRNGTRLDKN